MAELADGPIDRLAAALEGRYDLERELGRGGMATVYLAHDSRHDRPVALKVLSSHLGADGPARFLSEIRMAANLIHPHILPVFDSGEAEGQLYYVMPYVDGITLEERIRDVGRLDVHESLRIIEEIGDGLAHAHRHGLVHRDVKPSNIFLADGHAFLADFGVAKAVASENTALTQTGASLGTPLYMSPEQATGKGVDNRSDIYSLACVHYQMLTGEPPFSRPTVMAIIAAHCFEDVPSASDIRTDIPPAIVRSISRALAKSRKDRFATVDEYLSALHGVVSPAAGRRRERPRWPVKPIVAGATAALTIGAVAAAVVTRSGSPPAADASPLVPTRVVVAPLENRTDDASLDQVGRMGAEWITAGLHGTGLVDVVPSLTALQATAFIDGLQARGDTVFDKIEALASETGSGIVIYGGYYLSGDSLQYELQVTNAATGELVEALATVRGARSDPRPAIGELRDRVMGSLSVNLDERLVDTELSAVQPPSYAAYQAFDEGMVAYLGSRWGDAVGPLYRAYELDSTFVLPLLYAGLSLSNSRDMAAVDSLATILERRRNELSAYHRHWLAYMAARTHGRNEEARLAIREAARLAPGSKAVYNWAYAAQLTNRPREAVTALRTLDPERGPMRGWLPYWHLLTDNLHRIEEHADELAAARKARDLHPGSGWPIQMEGEALAALGELDEVRRIVAGLPSATFIDLNSPTILNAIGDELRHHGHAELSREIFETAAAWYEDLPEDERNSRFNAEAYATSLGNLSRDAEALEIVAGLRSRYPEDLQLEGWAGIIQATLGNLEEAERITARLEQEERRNPYSRGLYSLTLARIAGATGDADRAVSLLKASINQGFRPLRHPDVNLAGFVGYVPFDEVFTPLDR